MSLFLILDLHHNDLGQSVNKHGHVRAKQLAYLIKIGLFGAILHRIVKQGGADRIGVKAKACNYFGYGYRVRNVRIAADAELPLMETLCIFVSTLYFFDVIPLLGGAQKSQKPIKSGIICMCHINLLSGMLTRIDGEALTKAASFPGPPWRRTY